MPSSDFREPHLRHGDFLGAFAVLERRGSILMVRNERVVAGRPTHTWDLPGGQVEPGERIVEALARELDEETGLRLSGSPTFLFVQEGVREHGARRRHAWRSFFFAVHDWEGEATAGREILATRWIPRSELGGLLRAPYHDSFRQWLAHGGRWFDSVWREPG